MLFAFRTGETAKMFIKEQGMKIATDFFGLETKVKSSIETNLRPELVEFSEDVVHRKVQHMVRSIRPKLDETLSQINDIL